VTRPAQPTIARRAVRAARAALPERLRERGRLMVAASLEARRRRSPAVRGAALVFHAVGHRGGDPETELDPPVDRARLDAAVAYLARRYALVTAAELPSAARTRKPGERLPIAVTFDDDLPSHVEHAIPVFQRHGAVATAFLCEARTSFWWQLLQVAIDTRAVTPGDLPPLPANLVREAIERRPWAIGRLAKAIEELAPGDRDRVATALEERAPNPPRVLDPEGAAALVAAGWEIGFHTPGHYLLTTLDDDALDQALDRPQLGPSGTLPATLAYPHGKATAREAAAARRAGYSAAFTGYPFVFTEQTNEYLIGRLQLETSSLGRFALQLARSLSAT
jgi:peptidoglycan/xylan/chitin deacetylase (PgdA/CDA1 family)